MLANIYRMSKIKSHALRLQLVNGREPSHPVGTHEYVCAYEAVCVCCLNGRCVQQSLNDRTQLAKGSFRVKLLGSLSPRCNQQRLPPFAAVQ